LDEQQFAAPKRRLLALITAHVNHTNSEWARKVLDEFELMLPHWMYVLPKNLRASQDISQQDVPLRLVKA
jgi:glutamate synthase domain-containing protein 3